MGILVCQAVRLTIVLAVIVCGAYPLITTGIGNILFARQAAGSLIVRNGKAVGSELIAQRFAGQGYFHSRLSAAGGSGYDAGASDGSNLGPTSAVLAARLARTAGALRKEHAEGILPPDMLTASGSGLDPHISPEGALFQVKRVAAARALPEFRLNALVHAFVEQPVMGCIGEPRVNVLKLNMALDALAESEKSGHGGRR